MTSYRVYLRSDIQWTMHKFEADTPAEAVELTRQFADEQYDELESLSYEFVRLPSQRDRSLRRQRQRACRLAR